VRVVAGAAGGRRLVAPAGAGTRPTSDRVREAVFNALGSLDALEGARVLDLFGGSGALAVEALSRGAAHAVVVERSGPARKAIDANLATTGLADRARVVAGEAMAFLAGCADRFDLVLLDPPYGFEGWDELLAAAADLAAPGALVVVESDRPVPVPASWHVERDKRYGGTFVRITRPSPPPGGDRTELRERR
jgi:16S rRNA (guanine966-N2)-methyltransferase